MEEGNDIEDSDDFNGTLIPYDPNIPSLHYVTSENQREDIRDWVLSACIDASMDRTLLSRDSISKGPIYEGIFESELHQCIVTGYPIEPCDSITHGKYKASEHNWNLFVNKNRLK